MKQFASALFGFTAAAATDGNHIHLTKDGQILNDTNGLKDGDLVVVVVTSSVNSDVTGGPGRTAQQQQQQQQQQQRQPSSSSATVGAPSPADGLDFSGLLPSVAPPAGNTLAPSEAGGLNFSSLFGGNQQREPFL